MKFRTVTPEEQAQRRQNAINGAKAELGRCIAKGCRRPATLGSIPTATGWVPTKCRMHHPRGNSASETGDHREDGLYDITPRWLTFNAPAMVKLVWPALWSYSTDEERNTTPEGYRIVWPSYRELGVRAGVGMGTAHRAVKWLITNGWVVILEAGDSHDSNRYALIFIPRRVVSTSYR